MRKREIELWVKFVNFSVLSISLVYVLTFGKIGVFDKSWKNCGCKHIFPKGQEFFHKIM